jgi:hypothetical protein
MCGYTGRFKKSVKKDEESIKKNKQNYEYSEMKFTFWQDFLVLPLGESF